MNKERAREILKDFNKQIKDYGEDLMPEEKELSQALDIAIYSLDNDWVNIGKKKPTHEKDILICDTSGDISLGHYVKDKKYFYDYKLGYENPFVIAWRELKVEPYVRSEEND